MGRKKEHEKKVTNVAEWCALPAEKRKTEAQAATFAMSAVQRHDVRFVVPARQPLYLEMCRSKSRAMCRNEL
jgi:hypothetical protein